METEGQSQFLAFLSTLPLPSSVLCKGKLSKVLSIVFPGYLPGWLTPTSALETESCRWEDALAEASGTCSCPCTWQCRGPFAATTHAISQRTQGTRTRATCGPESRPSPRQCPMEDVYSVGKQKFNLPWKTCGLCPQLLASDLQPLGICLAVVSLFAWALGSH